MEPNLLKYILLFVTLIIIAIVGVIAAYKIAKLKFKKELEMDNVIRKRKILKEITDRTTVYSKSGIVI